MPVLVGATVAVWHTVVVVTVHCPISPPSVALDIIMSVVAVMLGFPVTEEPIIVMLLAAISVLEGIMDIVEVTVAPAPESMAGVEAAASTVTPFCAQVVL